ncbi:MAG: hypothetical protein HKN25_05015 [Pyrinomonadaceae bacterium]|nr:hypothetical protein [Pyrinomonadaceae bacterium]
MKKPISSLILVFLATCSINAQAIPDKVKDYLNTKYDAQESGNWQGMPDECGDSKVWSETADFNGDGQADHLVRFITGKNTTALRLNVVVFIAKDGGFVPAPIIDDGPYNERLGSFVMKSGMEINPGLGEEGEGPMVVLKNDGVMIQICETDNAGVYIYDNGEMKLVREVMQEKADDSSSASLPETIKSVLNKQYAGWTKAPKGELCGEKNLFETGDFDGDGKTDYAVHFMTKDKAGKPRLLLFAFIDRGSYFKAKKVSESSDSNDFPQMSFSTIKKGESVFTGEAEGDFVILNRDVIREYLCETDAAKTFEYKDGKFSEMDLYSP